MVRHSLVRDGGKLLELGDEELLSWAMSIT